MITKPYLTWTPEAGKLFTNHRDCWRICKRCPLSETRSQVVLARGQLPCDICFVGEAPGKSEDAIGVPFCGEAGHLMEDIIQAVKEEMNRPFRYALTNVVACLPAAISETSQDLREPTKEEAQQCSPRLHYFLAAIAKPKIIILVGKIAERYAPITRQRPHLKLAATDKLIGIDLNKAKWGAIAHPAFITRQPSVKQGLYVRRSVLTILGLLKGQTVKA